MHELTDQECNSFSVQDMTVYGLSTLTPKAKLIIFFSLSLYISV